MLDFYDDLTEVDISVGSKNVLYADDMLSYWPMSSDGDFCISAE